jgi:hypothetical protein
MTALEWSQCPVEPSRAIVMFLPDTFRRRRRAADARTLGRRTRRDRAELLHRRELIEDSSVRARNA